MCRQPTDIHDTASPNAYRGEFVNTSSTADTPEATGEYSISYRDARRKNMAKIVHKIPQTMVAAALNAQNVNRVDGNLVLGGMIAAAQVSAN